MAGDPRPRASSDDKPRSNCNGNRATCRWLHHSKLREKLRTFSPVSTLRPPRHFLENCECVNRPGSLGRIPSRRYLAHNVPEVRANPALTFKIAILSPILRAIRT